MIRITIRTTNLSTWLVRFLSRKPVILDGFFLNSLAPFPTLGELTSIDSSHSYGLPFHQGKLGISQQPAKQSLKRGISLQHGASVDDKTQTTTLQP